MSTQPKVPSNATDWQAIDIFVFSNGQQYSPPRKYHLNAHELNWWKSILSFLAKSQYGSLHSSIDLYTVGGERLEGPLQLSNGAAYVAVKTPDAFIDTGYSKYLLKASRSWEKSQARRSNSIETTKPDEFNVITAVSNTSVFKKKIEEEIVTCDIVDDVVTPETKVIDKPQPLINVHQYPQRESSIIYKHADKKRLSSTQRSSILRKSVTPLSATKQDTEKKGKDVQKNSKAPLKVNEITTSDNGGNNNKSKIPLKTAKRISVLKSDKADTEEQKTPLVSNNCVTDNLITERAGNECLDELNDSLLVANILKSTDSEIPSMVVPLTTNHVTRDNENKIPNDITEKSNSNQTTDAVKNVSKIDLVENIMADLSSEKDLNNQGMVNHIQTPQMQKVPNVSFAEKPDKNYVVISNGDIINLKLQIEVRNGVGLPKKINKTERKSQSYTDIDKTEKGSQINLDSEMVVQNKSLQSIFMSDFRENIGIRGDSGAVVIKCTCCQDRNYNISKMNTEASVNDSKVYVILIPTPGLDKKLGRCQCGNKVMDLDYTGIPQTTRPSIFHPVKKSTSIMALEINSVDGASDVSKSDKHTLPDSDKHASIAKVAESIKIESDHKHHVAITGTEAVCQKYIDKDQCKVHCTDDLEVDANNMKTLAECKAATATQTELCCLLLEARRHEDGRYSFHLPPLNVLKYYKI